VSDIGERQGPRLFVIWLDAVDGSIAAYDGVMWPDGTADIHHRNHPPMRPMMTPEQHAEAVFGKLSRIVWADQAAAETDGQATRLARAREYLEATADSCRVQARAVAEDVLRILDGKETGGE
jgi:hypothetical protein